MITLAYIALFFLAMLLLTAIFNAVTAPRLQKSHALTATPAVSVLIPARNEAGNIGRCLTSLLAQDYGNFSITVLDDQSEDDTAAIVRNLANTHANLSLIEGQPLPPNWVGKNWACQQLSGQADGEILIFCDADTWHAPSAIKNTVAWMQKYNLQLFSSFSQQKTVTLMEKLVIPVIDMLVFAALPLWLTYYFRSPMLAAANGQWFCVNRQAYEGLGAHKAVQQHPVEDVELSRLAKRKGHRILVAAGTGAVYCRMYHSAKEVWEGFTKNLYGIAGYNPVSFFGTLGILFATSVLPWLLLIPDATRGLALLAIGMTMLLRLLLAIRYRHPLIVSIFLHPVAVLITILIGLNSFFSIKRGKLQWKGRHIALDEMSLKQGNS